MLYPLSYEGRPAQTLYIKILHAVPHATGRGVRVANRTAMRIRGSDRPGDPGHG